MSFADCTITPVTSVICIPLPIGVLDKSGTLQDNTTNDKRHGREWWVGKNQKYLVRIKPSGKVSVVPPYVYLPYSYRKRGRCFITLLDITGDSTITPVTELSSAFLFPLEYWAREAY